MLKLGVPARYLLVAGVAIALFIALAADVVCHGLLEQHIDRAVVTAIHPWAVANPTTVSMVKGITFLGGTKFLTGLTLFAAAGLLYRGERFLARVWAVLMLGTGILTYLLKQLFARPRHEWLDRVAFEDSYSFPSGHSFGVVVAYGFLTFLLCRHLRTGWQRTFAWLLASAWMLTIGGTRLFLGVHYPTDVLAGFSLGVAWLCVGLAALTARTFNVRLPPLGGAQPPPEDWRYR
jgi:undecaprenyl-diphosphatase